MKLDKSKLSPIQYRVLSNIALFVKNKTGVDVTKKTISRKLENLIPRYLFFYLARKTTKYSLAAIGSFLKKDHATICHAIQEFEINFIDNYTDIIAEYFKINKANLKSDELYIYKLNNLIEENNKLRTLLDKKS